MKDVVSDGTNEGTHTFGVFYLVILNLEIDVLAALNELAIGVNLILIDES